VIDPRNRRRAGSYATPRDPRTGPSSAVRRNGLAHAGAGQRGYAMVFVMVFTSISMLSLTGGYQRLHQLFAFERSSDRVSPGGDGIEKALGRGLARFATGEPTVDGSNLYVCDLKIRDENGDPVTYRLTYEKLPDNEWSLVAEAAGSAQPTCPASFTDNACPAPSWP